MSWLRFLGIKSGRVVNTDHHLQGVDFHREKNRRLVWDLRSTGLSNGDSLPLEYFFYTNAQRKADALAMALRSRGYTPEVRPAAIGNGDIVVTGWTTPELLGDDDFGSWSKEMYVLGFQHDCEFDGFGAHGMVQPNPSLERP